MNKLLFYPIIMLSLVIKDTSAALGENIKFNPDFLHVSPSESGTINIEYFSKVSGAAPGVYSVSVFINDEQVENNVDIEFRTKNKGLSPYISGALIKKWGVEIPNLIDESNEDVFSINDIIPDTSFKLDLEKRVLKIFIPQIYLKKEEWFNSSPSLWDYGIPSFLTNYIYSGSVSNNSESKRNEFISLNSALNINSFRLRYSGTGTRTTGKKKQWDSNSIFIQRNHSVLQGGSITLGRNTIADNYLFDSFYFEGIQLYTNDLMLKPQLRGYSPSIKGIAYTNAIVTVKQFDQVIYQTNVPAGPFELSDFRTSSSGNIDVEITEADGRIRKFTQMIASVPVLLKENRIRHALSVGHYYDLQTSKCDDDLFFLASLGYGITDRTTLFGGGVYAKHYNSLMFGVGHLIDKIGAISFDFIDSHSVFGTRYIGEDALKGSAYRFKFNTGIDKLNTMIDFSINKYISKGYMDFIDYNNINFFHGNKHLQKKMDGYISIYQDYNDYGQLNITFSQTDYWHQKANKNLSVSYSFPFEYFSTTFSLNNNSSAYTENDKSIFFSLNMPLNNFSKHSGYLSYSNTYHKRVSTNQISYTDIASNGDLSYSVNSDINNKNVNNSAIVSYKSRYSYLNGSYANYAGKKNINYGAKGAITVHSGGLTLSQPLSFEYGNTLIDTNGVSDVKIKNRVGILSDYFGYAVIPNLTPYQKNYISIDIDSTDSDIEFLKTNQYVIPGQGAISKLVFNAKKGKKALFTLIMKNGKYVPFGSVVTFEKGNDNSSNIVSESGQVYMSGLSEDGVIIAKWGDGENQSCKAPFHLNTTSGYSEILLTCK